MHISDLLKIECIDLNAAVKNKQEAISYCVDLVNASHALSDKNLFLDAVWKREEQCSTGLGNEIAIPHAKSETVKHVSLCAMVAKDGIDFDSLDGSKVKLIFMIASPVSVSNEHLDVLARLSSLLVDDSFKQSLIKSGSKEEFLALISSAENKDSDKEENKKEETADSYNTNDEAVSFHYDIVAVTACPAGLSHTYMAAEALEAEARKRNLKIKVETDGAAGKRNILTAEDIANAKAVIVAADRVVEMARFAGKPMVRSGVVDGVRHPGQLIERALSPECAVYDSSSFDYKAGFFSSIYRHLMSALTYLLPLVATAGILAAISYLQVLENTALDRFFSLISISLSNLIIPVLSAFISFSIGGRLAIVAGFVGGFLAAISGAGVFGALVNGFVGGYIAFFIAKICHRYFKGLDATFALVLYPILGASLTSLFAQFISNDFCTIVDWYLYNYLIDSNNLSLVLLAGVIGVVMATDMGGPFNKLAYAFGVLVLADSISKGIYESKIMSSVMLSGMVPPLACGMAALFSKSDFSQREQTSAFKAIGSGLLFITEAALPYVKIQPVAMRIAFAAGALFTSVLVLTFNVALCAPHGGILIIPLSNRPFLALIFLLIGSIISALLMIFFRRKFERNKRSKKSRL